MSPSSSALGTRLRDLGRRLQRPVVVLWLVASWLVTSMYCHNDNSGNKGGQPGDGVYRPQLARGDGHTTYLMMRSLVFDRDLHFDNDLARFGDPWRQERTDTGRKSIHNALGPALVWAPALIAAHGAAKTANLFGADIAEHGYTMFHQRLVFLTSVLFAVLASLLGARAARRWVGSAAAHYAGVAILLGTNLIYYATFQPSYAHAMDAFLVAAFLAVWMAGWGDRRWRRFLLLGLLLGLAALVRVTNFVCGLALAFEIAWLSITLLVDRQKRPAARIGETLAWIGGGVLCLAIAVLVFTPQLAVWKIVYGEYFASPGGEGYVSLDRPNVVFLLWSSRHGWFSSHPLAYAGVVGLLAAPRGARRVAAALLIVVAAQVYVNSCVWDWWGMASFGARRLCSMALPVTVGLAFLLGRAATIARRLSLGRALPHVLAWVVLGWFVTWNLATMLPLEGGGRPTGYDYAQPRCCDQLPDRMKAIAEPIYDRVGNPFAAPASAMLAWRWDVSMTSWDEVAGNYADRVSRKSVVSGSAYRRRYYWNVPGVNFTEYLIDGLGPRQVQRNPKKNYRWSTARRVRYFMPLFLEGPRIVEMRLRPNLANGEEPAPLRVAINGETVHEGRLRPGWTRLRLEIADADLRRGINVVTLESPLRPYRRGDGETAWLPPLPDADQPVGLAVGQVDLTFPRAYARARASDR